MNDAAAANPAPLVVSRKFPAPRDLVFRAWSTSGHMRRWFAPATLSVAHAVIEFHPGGRFEICMRTPDGQDYWTKGRFGEIVAPKRLTFDCDVSFADGTPRFRVATIVDFADDKGATVMTVRQSYEVIDESARSSIGGAAEGWRTTLDRLGEEVARIGDAKARDAVHATFSIERHYAASPAQVFRAFIDAEAKARWFARADGLSVVERELDARPGGRERIKARWANGTTSTFDAYYFDVVPDERLIYAYDLWRDERKLSVSLATVEIRADGAGAILIFSEQGAFLDGYEDAGARERGTGMMLDQLGASLEP